MNQSSNSRRPTSFFGQAFQGSGAQLQQQTSSNSQASFDGAIKFRCYFEIKEETVDSKGNTTFTSVQRYKISIETIKK